MSFEDIREYFSRHFLGRIKVFTFEMMMPEPQVLATRRRVEAYPIRTRMRVSSAALFALKGLACHSKGFRFSGELVQVKGERLTRYVPRETAVGVVPLLKKSYAVREGLKRAQVLPQERRNRLQWQRERPNAPGEVLLAWYGPLIEGALVKMALNKQQGTLLIWYNPQSRHFNPGGVYLCRRLGVKAKPEWRWV